MANEAAVADHRRTTPHVIADDIGIGFDGGYRVELAGQIVGTVERRYREWERRSKGRRYVNARGRCKRAEYRAVMPGEWGRGPTFRTLRDAVAHLCAQAPA